MSDDVNWVNPVAVIKKRKRKTATKSSFAQGPSSAEEKENVPKKVVKAFNPFAAAAKKTASTGNDSQDMNSSMGLSSLTVDSQEKDADSQTRRDNEFLSALENHGNVTDLPDIDDRYKYEKILATGTSRNLRRRRTVANIRDLHDDSARDGFTAQNDVNKSCSIPLDFSIKSKMKIKFSDTSALRRIKKEDWNTAISFTPADPSKLPQKLAAACLYHVWPATIGKKFYPRFAVDFEPAGQKLRDNYWAEFEETIDAAFSALRTKFLPLFYVLLRGYSIVFYTHDGSTNPNEENQNSQSALSQSSYHSNAVPSTCIRAVIAPASKGLKEKLIKDGVIEAPKKDQDASPDSSPTRKYHRRNSCSASSAHRRAIDPQEFEFNPDDDESWDALRAMNVIKMKSSTTYDTKYHDGKDYSDVTEVIEGRTACQRLVNFLVDLKKAPGGEFPPTIISSAPFANSTVKQLQVKAGAEQLNIEGIILPSHQYEIHKVMHHLMLSTNRPTREYEVEYFTDKPTKALSNYVPGRSLENSSDETMSDFLSSKPQSLRQLKWKDEIFNIV